MAQKTERVTVACGDGIGPEIMASVLKILRAGGAGFEEDRIEIGEKVYQSGFDSGVKPSDWETIQNNRFFLKAPVTTPQGGGFKSLNVTVRAALGLFANVRPSRALCPYVPSKHPDMDVVIVRENEEGLYTGVEYRQSPETCAALKLTSAFACRRIARFAFQFARAAGRKKVTCMTKDNIMKMTDGLFHKMFQETAENFPDIESEHWIIDIGAAKFATAPESFDVLVLPNLYGDILSDVAAQTAGSVGLGASGNIGETHAVFEAVHGSAPRRAGRDMANPSGLLQAALMMLSCMGQDKTAQKIQDAYLKTLEDGVHTYDIFKEPVSKIKAGTAAFTQAVIDRLGDKPQRLDLPPPGKGLSGAPSASTDPPAAFAASDRTSEARPVADRIAADRISADLAKAKRRPLETIPSSPKAPVSATASEDEKNLTAGSPSSAPAADSAGQSKMLEGIDVFIDNGGRSAQETVSLIQAVLKGGAPEEGGFFSGPHRGGPNLGGPDSSKPAAGRGAPRGGSASAALPFKLSLIADRGAMIYPESRGERSFVSDQFRCRFLKTEERAGPQQLWGLLCSLSRSGLDVIKTENLYSFSGGERGYSLLQGEK